MPKTLVDSRTTLADNSLYQGQCQLTADNVSLDRVVGSAFEIWLQDDEDEDVGVDEYEDEEDDELEDDELEEEEFDDEELEEEELDDDFDDLDDDDDAVSDFGDDEL